MSNPDPVQDLVDALRRMLTSTSTPAPPVTTSTFTAASPSPSAVTSPMAKPTPFTGSAEDCNGFLLQCSLVLEMQPHLYPDYHTKVAFIISQLKGKALRWAEPLWTQKNPVVHSLSSFINHFKEVFGKPAWDSSIAIALLDSGSAGNFISGALCRQLQLKTTATPKIYQIHSVTGKPLRQVQYIVGPLHLQVGILHMEEIHLLVLEDSMADVILGDVFCPKEASKLPPHRPWDCTIDLIHGEPVPRGKIYSLSIPEEKAMEEYINEALSQGYIRPSTSPAASSFFFVAKKDGGLRPCNYRSNHHKIQLDLRSTYNLIRIREGDEWKTAFVTPTGHYEYLVMPYGLVNAPSIFQDFMHEVLQEFLHKSVLVYIDDILIYSRSMADHCQYVAEVLQCLRDYHLFLKAEKCTFHQPSVQFLGYNIDRSGIRMDERKVDASTTAVGAVLSQQQGNPHKLLPCAFYSRKLNPAEVNYDIGNRELLAIKLALEEWRPWLEGAKHPFMVLTDHKNLEYLWDAKRLNPCQARWALFFTRFNFTISYRPGSKNVKADALSRIHSPEESTDDPEPIIPEKLFVSPIIWSEETLPESSASTNTPLGCPQGLQYIPRTRCTPLIHSSHTSLGTGNPGVNETLSLLKQRFWWPNMASDVRRYVQGCRECAISKSPRHLPSGKLQPLPVPNRPWSHLGVDFITDVPVSNGCTCVLVVLDRFSKSC
ncbi:hypothetical protein QTP70_010865 [Hemibagrus guttatus]|uniref:Gypsy retrotransposon integrase-like protein 1 n=1 Tax=Hemibagrus guttatus TaxID=175788 RepID=A0AAE0UI91_9TELE|nr:hypothetical protein QTP70_010865 [Hemibagrus guttatus]